MLSDDIKVWENKVNIQGVEKVIKSYQLFVKKPNTEQAFNLDLSSQAYNSLQVLNPKKHDILTITKGTRKDEKTGGILPIAVFELTKAQNVIKQQEKPLVSTIDPKKVLDYLEAYKRNVEANRRDLSHFIGCYIRVNELEKELVKKLAEAFKTIKGD